MASPAQALRPDPGSVPDAPGCYQFRDPGGRVLYVGKAKSLRQRLASYFASPETLPPRTRAMVGSAAEVDWIVVDSEVEALHLELTLIQRHRPRYNIRYRDDKSYPYLVLSTSQEVPRAQVQRGRVAAGDRRFGPYAHAYAIRETLDLLLRVFPVRTCTKGVYDRAARTDRACLLHHIDRCAAPCVGAIGVTDHRALVDGLASFLDGESSPVIERLEREMREASEARRYEIAARRRDQLDAARRALEKQQVVSPGEEDLDALAVHEDELEAAVQAFFVRRGRLVGRMGWMVEKVEPLATPELLTSALMHLYSDRSDDVPPRVLVPAEPADAHVLEDLLTDLRREGTHGRAGHTVRIVVPRRGRKAALLRTVEENAVQAFQRSRLRRANDFDARNRSLRELQEALALDDAPLRIECFDVSHLGGTGVVGSMVVFEDGLARTSEYRRFKLRMDRNDDVAAIAEIVRRRFTRFADAMAEGGTGTTGGFGRRPDLVIVDGGSGQLDAAIAAAADAGTHDVAFVGLAKRNEELHRPTGGPPVVLPRGSEALYLVQRVRDEAHRFAITYQRDRRGSSVRTSGLDDIPGIGPTRRTRLLRRFGSVAAVRRASLDELAEVPGISRTLATVVREHLGGDHAREGGR